MNRQSFFIIIFIACEMSYLVYCWYFLLESLSEWKHSSWHHKKTASGELSFLERWSLSQQIAIFRFYRAIIFSTFKFAPITSWDWARLRWTRQTGSLLIVQSHNLTSRRWPVTFVLLREGSFTLSACLCEEYLLWRSGLHFHADARL